jgi:sugar phosphate isomerase/epimerase
MDIGFSTAPNPCEEYFQFAFDNDFDRLDLGCSAPPNFPHTFTKDRIKRVKELGEKYNMPYGLHSSSFVNTAELMPLVREASEQHLLDYITLSKDIGAEYCVIHCGYYSKYKEAVMQNLFKTFRPAVKLAEELDLPLVIENMNAVHPDSEIVYLGVTIEELNQVFDAVPSTHLGLALDIGHAALLEGGVASWVEAFPDKIFHLHLSDNDCVLDQHLPIGDGDIDFQGAFDILKSVGFTGTATLEVGNEDNRLKSLKYLRNLKY